MRNVMIPKCGTKRRKAPEWYGRFECQELGTAFAACEDDIEDELEISPLGDKKLEQLGKTSNPSWHFNISVDWWFYGIIFSDRLGIIFNPAHPVHHQATSLCSRKLPTWPSAMRLRPSKVTGQLEDAAMKLKRPCLRACGVCVSFKQNSRIIQILQGGHDPCSRQYGNVWKPFRKLVLLSLNLNAIQKRWRLPSGKLA